MNKKTKKTVNIGKYLSDRDEKIKTMHPDIKEQLNMIHTFERARSLMYRNLENKNIKKLLELQSYVSDEDLEIIKNAIDILTLDGWSIEYENYRIKISFPDLPVRLYDNKISPDIEYLNKQLSRNIAKMIFKLDPVPKMDSVLVWIKYYMPIKHYDVDNNCYKSIIDGLTKSLIESDDREKLMYGFSGGYSKENPHTEVYVYDKNYICMDEILELKEE